MRNRYSTLLVFFLAVAVTVAGCDQASQTAAPDNSPNRYIISMKKTSVGDASSVNIQDSSQTVTVPDTVAYAVQGFTVNKNYNWTVNDSDVPVETRSDETYVWEARKGEFVTVVYAQGDPMTNVNSSSSTTNTLAVNSPDDDINTERITVNTVVPKISGQIGRLSSYSTLASLTSTAGLDDSTTLGGSNAFTLLAPQNDAFGALGATPTQATDPDEAQSSSVLADLLKYHVISGSVASGDISDGMTAQTLFGTEEVSFGVSGGTVTVNGSADVVRADYPATNGVVHGIDGLLLPSTASVDFTDRTVDSLSTGATPDTLEVDGSFIPQDGGFIVLHDKEELTNQGAIPSIVGVSEYISADSVANGVKVPVDTAVTDTTTIGAMPHKDTNDNQAYDFSSSNGAEDAPYTLDGSPVIDYAEINIE